MREGHIARTRVGLDGEREHLLTHPVTINGQTHIAMAVARARADGTLVVEPGMVKVYTPADFQRVMENDNVSDNLIELPGSVEDYGGVEQRDSLLNMVNRSQTEEEARGVIHAFEQMRRIGHKLVNVSLHYKGNQGLDLIFQSQDGHLGTYAVMEAKHGKGPDSLAVDENGFVQGSPGYNKDRLNKYLKKGDKTQKQLAQQLLDLLDAGELKSYAAFYGSKSLYELQPVLKDKQKIKAVRIP